MARGRPRKVKPEPVQPEVTEPAQPVTDSGKPPAVVPATFEIVGRILTCTVCGTRASKDVSQNLFCSNLHNHPLLEETPDVE